MSTTILSPSTAVAERLGAEPAERPAATMRLTRRGRLVVLALALGVALALFWAFGGVSSASDDGDRPEVLRVATGQTLWEIASARSGGEDTLKMVAEIKRLNDLDSGSLLAGQELLVPPLAEG